MATGGQNKKLLYVGGLAEEVDEKMLHAAFIPFGDIIGDFDSIYTFYQIVQTLRYHLISRQKRTEVSPLSNLKMLLMPPLLEITWMRQNCLVER